MLSRASVEKHSEFDEGDGSTTKKSDEKMKKKIEIANA